jgi:3'(2'), 5'-bisphosphate nucleotidase
METFTMPYEQEKQVSAEAALVAAELCEQVRREMVPQAIEKNDGTPVTVADFVSQAVICRVITEAFPTDPIVGEESAAMLREPDMVEHLEKITAYVQRIAPDAKPESVSAWIDRGTGDVGPRYWTLDPIDGTKGFLRGDQYAVAVALIEGGEVKVGVLACPWLLLNPENPKGDRGMLFVAVRGQGATMVSLNGGDPYPIHVASPHLIANLPFAESFESAHSAHSLQVEVAKAAGIQVPSLRMDGQAKYGAVARGEAVLYLRFLSPESRTYIEKIWDHAAGALIVEEAGGRVTDMHGRPLDFSQGANLNRNEGIIASNGSIHDKILEVLKVKGY